MLLFDGTEILNILPGIAHLFLALIVVASSWVGWANSSRLKQGTARVAGETPAPSLQRADSPENKEWTVTRTFSREFVVLLVDVLLVILYFILACGAERPEGGKISPSASAETWTLLWILVVYMVWDALTKLKFNRRLFRAYVDRGWITWGCTALALLVWACHRHVTHPRGVIITDVILILIVLTFRAFKDQPKSTWRRPLLVATVGFLIVTWCFPSIMGG